MIKECISPQFDGEVPINPFDVDEGVNFNFKIIKKGDYPNYDKSSFQSPSALYENDDSKLEKVVESLYDLTEFKFEKEMKSYDELAVLFNKITGENSVNENQIQKLNDEQGFNDSLDDLVTEEDPVDDSDNELTDISNKFDTYFSDD